MPEMLSLNRTARRLGVTARWLRAEAESGRIPSLPAGKGRFVFDFEIASKALSDRIRQNVADEKGGDRA